MGTLFNRSDSDAIRERLLALSPESQAKWGKMNVGQMLCHVNDGFLMAAGERLVEDKSNIFMRTVVKFLILNVVPMPKSAPAAPEIDQFRNGTPPDDFERDREAVLASLERMAAMPADHRWAKHPAFGQLNRDEWGKLGYKHIDHHLKQFGA